MGIVDSVVVMDVTKSVVVQRWCFASAVPVLVEHSRVHCGLLQSGGEQQPRQENSHLKQTDTQNG